MFTVGRVDLIPPEAVEKLTFSGSLSIETTLSIEGDVSSLRLGQIPAGQKFLPMVETFAPSCIKTHAHVAGFYESYGVAVRFD